MDKTEEIELRSEKVRNIIGQIPSKIIRIGITIIFVVVLALLTGAIFFKFDRTIDAPTTLYMKSNRVCYTIEIPINKLKYLETGQRIVIRVHDGSSFTSKVQNIDTTLRINKEQAYFQIYGLIDNAMLKVDGQVEAQGSVYIGKTNVINYVLGSKTGEPILSPVEGP